VPSHDRRTPWNDAACVRVCARGGQRGAERHGSVEKGGGRMRRVGRAMPGVLPTCRVG